MSRQQPAQVVAQVRVVVGKQDSPGGDLRTLSTSISGKSKTRSTLGGSTTRLLPGNQRKASSTKGAASMAAMHGDSEHDAVCRQVIFTERETDVERRPLADFTLDADVAAVQPDEFLHQGETDARSFVSSRPRTLDSVESLEEPRKLLGRNARSRVAHANSTALPARCNSTAISPSKVYFKAFERRLRTIFSHMSRST